MLKLKLTLFLFILGTISCATSKKTHSAPNYVTICGKIEKPANKTAIIAQKNGYLKILKVSETGEFSDTLHLGNQQGIFRFSDGNEFTNLFLKNGYKIHMTLNTDFFDETIKYCGEGAQNCNYLAQKFLLMEKYFNNLNGPMDDETFNQWLKNMNVALKEQLKNSKNLDPKLVEFAEADNTRIRLDLMDYYINLGKDAFFRHQNDFKTSFELYPDPN